MSDLIFLPDREGRDELTNAAGFVRCGTVSDDLKPLADRLTLPAAEAARTDCTMWRGVLALALLADAWPDAEAAITLLTVDGTTSLFAAWVLSARPAEARRDALHLVLLSRGGKRCLLGIADAHEGLILPATPTDFTDLLPARAAWYDVETAQWQDPVPYLNEHDRAVLYARLEMMGLDAPAVAAFKADLNGAGRAEVEAVAAGDESALSDLSTRIQAVCGMADFSAFAIRREPVTVGEDNPFVRVYSGVDVRYAPDAAESCTYLWNGVPFARSGAALGLHGTNDPRQGDALEAIRTEVLLMAENSTAWNRKTAVAIGKWADSSDAALLPQVRAQAELIRHYHAEKGRQPQGCITLTWPWDASSGAVRQLLRENLGDAWMSGAENPFADRLTKLTGHVLGDTALHGCCACADGVLLPPLSQAMALCTANAGDDGGLVPDGVRFVPQEDGGITASFLLRGQGEIRMERSYAVTDILVLTEEESPCIAVWPCLPMPRWKAYHVFARGGQVEIAALRGGQWETLPAAEPSDAAPAWRCLHTETYPACLTLMQGESCLGALPNSLPLCRISESGDAVAAIDMGASSTAVALTVDGKAVEPERRQLTRLLVMPQEMPDDDFLISLTPTAVTPSAVALTGDGDELFTDGYVYAVTRFDTLKDMIPGTVHTALKWRADAVSVRARRILLHQVMLGTSLNAMLCGVKSLRWRVTVADEMGDEGRNALLDMVEEISAVVAQETGLPITEGKSAVIWAEEAAALHAYLRGEGGQRGAIAVLDVGGGSTKLHLWLPGKNRPVAGAVMMEGSQTVLLGALRENPEMLRMDFADCGNDDLIAAVDVLCEQLRLARESLAQADKALLMLDALLDEYRQPVIRHLYDRFNAQQPTYLQAILLDLLGGAMFSVGLMLEQAGDDSFINHLFPADLPICLTGQGAWLLETLTPQLRNGFQRIVRAPMALRHPIRSVTVRPAPLPAMGVALGMTALKETEMTIDPPVIRTRVSFSELMRTLTLQLFQCYPMHVWQLHPGLFDAYGNLTPAGEDTLRRAASIAYDEGEDIPGAVMDFLSLLRRTPVLPDPTILPGD